MAAWVFTTAAFALQVQSGHTQALVYALPELVGTLRFDPDSVFVGYWAVWQGDTLGDAPQKPSAIFLHELNRPAAGAQLGKGAAASPSHYTLAEV